MRRFGLAVCLVFLSILSPFSGNAFGEELARTHTAISGTSSSADLNPVTKPTKESFIAAWESYQKSLPTTVMLERTQEPGVYLYETSLFPFKGKLKVTNVLITEDLDYYYDYNLNDDETLRGVVETEFVGTATEDLYKKYPYSLEIWKKGNFLFYAENTGQWVGAKAYAELQSSGKTTVPPTQSRGCQEVWSGLLPILFVLLFLLAFLLFLRRSYKNQTTKVDLSMERQLRAIEIGEKSLALQNEQTALLRQLVGKEEGH